MTVYADVLIVINLIIDYFLISLSARILKKNISVLRIILSSLIGAASSLYIFLPRIPIFFEAILKLCVCVLMAFAAFGYKNTKTFFRSLAVISAVSLLYGGGMLAIWYIFKPNGMIINNSVVYFNVSPLFLILFSIIAYLVIVLARKITEVSSVYSQNCKINLIADGNKAEVQAIVDTGNSVEDIFSLSEIIVIDESVAYSIFDGYPTAEQLKRRYRALPLSTVSGVGMLDGYRCDKAYISYNGQSIELKSPILAISKAQLQDGYEAIVNPKIFE